MADMRVRVRVGKEGSRRHVNASFVFVYVWDGKELREEHIYKVFQPITRDIKTSNGGTMTEYEFRVPEGVIMKVFSSHYGKGGNYGQVSVCVPAEDSKFKHDYGLEQENLRAVTEEDVKFIKYTQDDIDKVRAENLQYVNYSYDNVLPIVLHGMKSGQVSFVKPKEFVQRDGVYVAVLKPAMKFEPSKDFQKIGGVEVLDKEAVIVKGFLVLSSLPSKALLDKALPELFKNTRIGTKFVKIVSGYFYNKLGSLSRKFYKYILEKHAVWAGFGYIVPAHRVQTFINEVEELRKDYEEFEKQLREFLEEGKIPEDISDRAKVDPEYVELVRQYLKERGIEDIKVPDITERVKIRLVPFSVDMSMVEEYLEEKAVKSVQKEIEAVKQEMFENLRKQLEEKMNVIFEKLKNYERIRMSKAALKKLKEDINSVIKTAEDLGANVHRVDALKRTLDAIEELEALERGKKKGVKVEATDVDGRMKALLQELGINSE